MRNSTRHKRKPGHFWTRQAKNCNPGITTRLRSSGRQHHAFYLVDEYVVDVNRKAFSEDHTAMTNYNFVAVLILWTQKCHHCRELDFAIVIVRL